MFAFRRLLPQTVKNVGSARKAHTLPDLPYPYEALEPIISRDIMYLHHAKHHNAYISNLNVAEDKMRSAIEKDDVSAMIAVQPALKFNGGGHLNHSIFWQNLSPTETQPGDKFCRAMINDFGSLAQFKKDFAAATIAIQGSGWGWLGLDPQSGYMRIATCANQDPLQATTGLIPLLGIDVWEHAYYLQYKNVRADYVNCIMDIINWQDVSSRWEAGLKKPAQAATQ
uniref:Superoxide dismutase n=1 Tax=Lasioderma serricorne TaxID=295660 RepID=A0A8F2PN33_9COLE|nr:Mn superoxide dismutase [Lasioderma serricorne]